MEHTNRTPEPERGDLLHAVPLQPLPCGTLDAGAGPVLDGGATHRAEGATFERALRVRESAPSRPAAPHHSVAGPIRLMGLSAA